MDQRTALLARKAHEIRRATLRVHRTAPETRVASSLSSVEIFTALYYGGRLRQIPDRPLDDARDRIIVSKGHGSICLYPILADLGFFSPALLETVCKEGSMLGGIPDPCIPGYESVNGSLGHGLGVACGISLALRQRQHPGRVVVVCGDGELNEGSVWEAVMFAAQHRLSNITLIVDYNRRCMLDFSANVMDLSPLDQRFVAFGWKTTRVEDGHDVASLDAALAGALDDTSESPRVIIAHTIKGKGVPSLENNPLAHVQVLSTTEIDYLLAGALA